MTLPTILSAFAIAMKVVGVPGISGRTELSMIWTFWKPRGLPNKSVEAELSVPPLGIEAP